MFLEVSLGFRGGFLASGLEEVQVFDDLVLAALDGIDHAMEAGQGWGVGGESFGVGPESGFDGSEAAESPGVVGELVEEFAFLGVGRFPGVGEFGGEGFEFSDVFAGNDHGFGVDARFEGVESDGGFALVGGRSGGLLSVASIGFYLLD
ncbi:MAG TPA: hypothetical protein VG456_00670 [Candidatus Sulfopaludibacter sp.]|nr:hypothetical protein [Candidatus Sulfopaludibacter sp.]